MKSVYTSCRLHSQKLYPLEDLRNPVTVLKYRALKYGAAIY